jgi:peptide chain release factor 1
MRELAEEELTRSSARATRSAELKVLLVPEGSERRQERHPRDPRRHRRRRSRALRVGSLPHVYAFAERNGWKVEVLSMSESGVGGIKEVIATIAAAASTAS